MYQKPTVPRSIGGVLDDTFNLYRASFSTCWLPMLVLSLVSTANNYYNLRTLPQVTTRAGLLSVFGQYQTQSGTYWINLVIAILSGLIIYGILVQNIVSVSRGETPRLSDSFNKSLRRAPALLLAAIIFGIALAVGFILLIIPGFYVLNRLQFFMVPLISEQQGPGESLGSSWRLVGGNWWRTATIVFVMFVVIYILFLLVALVGNGIATMIGATPVNPLQVIGKTYLVTIVASSLVGIFTTPLLVTVFVAVYQDLVLRKGGGDLEARLGALPKG